MAREIEPDGEAIKDYRLRGNLSVDQLADKAGCSVRTIRSLESGRKCFMTTLQRVAAALEVDVEMIQKGEEKYRKKVWGVKLTINVDFNNVDETEYLAKIVSALQAVLLPGTIVVPTNIKPSNSIEIQLIIVVPHEDDADYLHYQIDELKRQFPITDFFVEPIQDDGRVLLIDSPERGALVNK